MQTIGTMMRRAAPSLALAFLLALLMAAPAAAQHGPGWVIGANGCRAWNPAMQPYRSFTWSGPCENGLVSGTGVLQWYDNGVPGDRYEGAYRDGHMSGHGVYLALDGERYEGEFKDDSRTGPGTYITRGGDRYEGTFQRSVLQGEGVGIFANGDRYQGGFWNNRAHGEGSLRKADGTVISGDWINGCLRQGDRRYAVGVGAEAAKCP